MGKDKGYWLFWLEDVESLDPQSAIDPKGYNGTITYFEDKRTERIASVPPEAISKTFNSSYFVDANMFDFDTAFELAKGYFERQVSNSSPTGEGGDE